MDGVMEGGRLTRLSGRDARLGWGGNAGVAWGGVQGVRQGDGHGEVT